MNLIAAKQRSQWNRVTTSTTLPAAILRRDLLRHTV